MTPLELRVVSRPLRLYLRRVFVRTANIYSLNFVVIINDKWYQIKTFSKHSKNTKIYIKTKSFPSFPPLHHLLSHLGTHSHPHVPFARSSSVSVSVRYSIESIVLGGTHQKYDFNRKPCPFDAKFIHAGCVAKVAALKNCQVLEEWVGLRPGRKTVRLECDQLVTGLYKSKVFLFSLFLFSIQLQHKFFFSSFVRSFCFSSWKCEFETENLTCNSFSCFRLLLLTFFLFYFALDSFFAGERERESTDDRSSVCVSVADIPVPSLLTLRSLSFVLYMYFQKTEKF